MPDYGTDRLSLQNTTGAIQNNSGDPLLSTDDSGSSSYAFGPAMSAGIYLGVQNGNIGAPPPNIDEAIAEDNPLPYFSITDSSSGRIVASAVADAVQASGYAIRFTMTNALSGDEIFLERVISVPASRATTVSFQPRGAWTAATNSASFRAFTRAQYIAADGTTTTGAAGTGEATGTAIFAYNSTAREVQANPNTTGVAPTNAAFLSAKVGVRLTANIVGTATVDLVEVRLDQGRTQYILTDGDQPNAYGYGSVFQTFGDLIIRPNETGLSGSNPSIRLTANGGKITLDAAKVGSNGSAVVNGDILLQPKSGGFVYIGDGSGTYDVNLYRHDADNLRTDDRFTVGDRTSPSTSQVDAQGVILDAASGYVWADRSPNTSATDASLFLSSGFFNGNLQMVRFFRKITVGGTALTGTGHILVANNSTTAPSFGAGSDYRLKDDIRDASDTIVFSDKISSLRPVLYTEKETGDELLGFIAHEVQDVIPEAVEGEKDGVDENGDPTIQNLYPAKFIVYLVGAVKELTARVAELEEKVATLESRP
jgi:hypothetical protein